MIFRRFLITAVSLSLLLCAPDTEARTHKDKAKRKTPASAQAPSQTAPGTGATTEAAPAVVAPTKGAVNNRESTGGSDDTTSGTTPVVVPPSSLVDLTTAKFSRLDLDLKDGVFLEAKVRDFRIIAENMDMNNGTLELLSVQFDEGVFQEFTVDSLRMWTRGSLQFDTQQLLNQKVLQFRQPASARVRVAVSQNSLNKFLNAPFILERLSGSAKKRVPILSTLARQDVNFGFSFLKGDLHLDPENRIRLTMDSKLGMGKVGMPVTLTFDTRLQLSDGWVSLADTKLHTGSHAVPHDLSDKIVNRINSLSKWGSQSDDIKFQFTDLVVIPGERLELEGSALINRLRFARNQEPEPRTVPHGQSSESDVNSSGELR
jgi:hypothetical protein